MQMQYHALQHDYSAANISERALLPPQVVVRLVVLQWKSLPETGEQVPYVALESTQTMSSTHTAVHWQLPCGTLHAMHTLDYCACERLRAITDQPIAYWSQVATVGEYAHPKGGMSALSIEYIFWVSSQETKSTPPPLVPTSKSASTSTTTSVSSHFSEQRRNAPMSAALEWVPLEQLPQLSAHDQQLIDYAQQHLEQRAQDIRVLARLTGQEFTLQQLHAVSQTLRHEQLDLANFRRTVLASGQVEATGATRKIGKHRPAAVYRLVQSEEQTQFDQQAQLGQRALDELPISADYPRCADSQSRIDGVPDVERVSSDSAAGRRWVHSALASLIPHRR